MKIEKKTLKIVNMLVLIIILFAFCVIAVQDPEKYTFILLPSKYLVIILAVLGIISISYLCIFFIKIIFVKKSFFEINESGIYNGIGFTKKKQIDWKIIKEIDTVSYQGILRIRVKVFDNKPFLESTDFITKFILRQTIKELGTPILIDNVYLKCSFDELSKLIFDSWEKYKSR